MPQANRKKMILAKEGGLSNQKWIWQGYTALFAGTWINQVSGSIFPADLGETWGVRWLSQWRAMQFLSVCTWTPVQAQVEFQTDFCSETLKKRRSYKSSKQWGTVSHNSVTVLRVLQSLSTPKIHLFSHHFTYWNCHQLVLLTHLPNSSQTSPRAGLTTNTTPTDVIWADSIGPITVMIDFCIDWWYQKKHTVFFHTLFTFPRKSLVDNIVRLFLDLPIVESVALRLAFGIGAELGKCFETGLSLTMNTHIDIILYMYITYVYTSIYIYTVHIYIWRFTTLGRLQMIYNGKCYDFPGDQPSSCACTGEPMAGIRLRSQWGSRSFWWKIMMEIWGNPSFWWRGEYGAFHQLGYPVDSWFTMENPIEMDDVGVSLCQETTICCHGKTIQRNGENLIVAVLMKYQLSPTGVLMKFERPQRPKQIRTQNGKSQAKVCQAKPSKRESGPKPFRKCQNQPTTWDLPKKSSAYRGRLIKMFTAQVQRLPNCSHHRLSTSWTYWISDVVAKPKRTCPSSSSPPNLGFKSLVSKFLFILVFPGDLRLRTLESKICKSSIDQSEGFLCSVPVL